jgi:hypothetical protein
MKTQILFLVILASLFFSTLSFAHVVEVNHDQKVVYFSPTPNLTVVLNDLGDLGILSLSLDYDAQAANREREELLRIYPGYSFQVLMAQHMTESVVVHIPEAGIHQETLIKQGQMGPYMNLQMQVSKAQMGQIKALAKGHQDILKFSLPVASSYRASRVLEQYQNSSVCTEIQSQNFGSLVQSLLGIKKPEGMKFEETFMAYKREILENCFDFAPTKIGSFKELLRLALQKKENAPVITATHSEVRNLDVKYELIPKVNLELN